MPIGIPTEQFAPLIHRLDTMAHGDIAIRAGLIKKHTSHKIFSVMFSEPLRTAAP